VQFISISSEINQKAAGQGVDGIVPNISGAPCMLSRPKHASYFAAMAVALPARSRRRGFVNRYSDIIMLRTLKGPAPAWKTSEHRLIVGRKLFQFHQTLLSNAG